MLSVWFKYWNTCSHESRFQLLELVMESEHFYINKKLPNVSFPFNAGSTYIRAIKKPHLLRKWYTIKLVYLRSRLIPPLIISIARANVLRHSECIHYSLADQNRSINNAKPFWQRRAPRARERLAREIVGTCKSKHVGRDKRVSNSDLWIANFYCVSGIDYAWYRP